MVNAGVEPNVHTYGALIDGCARAGQVAKAFGAYGIMRSKVSLGKFLHYPINTSLTVRKVFAFGCCFTFLFSFAS
jgi:pentatricopeptide repeat protein